MCYGKPDELLAKMAVAGPPLRNSRGHTAQDDFDHFCAYSGLNLETATPREFAWAKAAYFSAWRPT